MTKASYWYASSVNKDRFKVFTKSKSENEKVGKLKKFIKALKDIEPYTKVYPANIQQGLSNAIKFDISENDYVINQFS